MGAQFSKTDTKVDNTKKLLVDGEVSRLLTQRKQVDQQLTDIENRRDFIVGTLSRNKYFNWFEILDTIVEKSSENICITSLKQQLKDEKVIIIGKVPSHKYAHAFAVAVAESDHFKSAVISEIKKDRYFKGLIEYTMECMMDNDRSGNNNDR
jgi:hypothetical protein